MFYKWRFGLSVVFLSIFVLIVPHPVLQQQSTPLPIESSSTNIPLNESNNVVLAHFFEGYCQSLQQNDTLLVAHPYTYDLASGNKILTITPSGGSLSPDGNYAVFGGEVYDFHAGKKLFEVPGTRLRFSPDSRFLIVEDEGVYTIPGGEKVMPLPRGVNAFLFSSDSRYLYVPKDGLFRTSDWKLLFKTIDANKSAVFNPDNSLLVVTDDGVYEIATARKLLEFPDRDRFARFSPDGKWLSVSNMGVYEVATWEKRFDYRGGKKGQFSPDSQLLLIYNDGIYELNSQQKIMDVEGEYFQHSFSPDNQLLALTGNGVYHIATGEKLFNIKGSDFSFSADGKLLAVNEDAIYEVSSGRKLFRTLGGDFRFSQDNSILLASRKTYVPEDGEFDAVSGCLVYADASRFEPFPFGLAFADKNLVYSAPSKDAEVISFISEFMGLIVVDGQNNSHEWYRVKGMDGWLDANYFPLEYTPPQGLPEIEP